ncbi:MAG: YitT family protein [Peptostreptococcaceae bacterium]|nr:YitT family protein [Peptostreptococcaceae bacterium]MDY5739605.1 YitT family protein [Anaerovoracaceae bacterium]
MPSKFAKKHPAYRVGKRFLFVVLGAVIIGFNIKSFVRTGGLFPGGFSGMTLLIQQILDKYADIRLSYTTIYIPLNLVPVYIGIKWLGKKFTFYSLFVILLSSIVVDLLPDIVITYDVLLICIFGGVINGFAIWLCLIVGASAGGTDFISIYMSEKHGIDAWNYILLGNICILFIAGVLFGFDRAMYSIIFQYCTTQVISTLFKRYRKHTLIIITDQPSAVYGRIKEVTHHDATLFTGTGCYQGTDRNMLYSVVSSDEVDKVINEIQAVDHKAFINVLKTEQINGRFYKKPHD